MYRRNIFLRIIGALARKFRRLQEIWILPWLGNGKLAAVPRWALDIFVLVLKLFCACIMAVARTLIPENMKSLHGETILVTGAGSGIGRELAIQFAELGATVVCWDKDARRNNAVVAEIRRKDGDRYKKHSHMCIHQSPLEQLVGMILKTFSKREASAQQRDIYNLFRNWFQCFGYTVDVTVREQVASTAIDIRRLVDVTMVVSNAGELTFAPLLRLSPEYVAKLIEVNLLAHIWIIQAFLPSMMERRHGHIVAVNSSAGLMPYVDMVPYCAAKSGLRGFMDSLSEELRLDTFTKDVYTTSVYLGTVSTGLYPTPSHRFVSWYSELSAKEAAKIIIAGIRKNKRCICIPTLMRFLTGLCNLMPYRIRIIFMDFFNFGHRGWFCFC